MFIITANNYISINKPIKHNLLRLSDFYSKKLFSLFSLLLVQELCKKKYYNQFDVNHKHENSQQQSGKKSHGYLFKKLKKKLFEYFYNVASSFDFRVIIHINILLILFFSVSIKLMKFVFCLTTLNDLIKKNVYSHSYILQDRVFYLYFLQCIPKGSGCIMAKNNLPNSEC